MINHRESAMIVANRLPYPVDDGWKARTFQIVRAVARQMHTTLVTFEASCDSSAALAAVGRNLSIVNVPPPRVHTPLKLALGLLTRTPLQIWNQHSREMSHTVRHLAQKNPPDVCIFATSFMFPLAVELPPATIRVIDTHNIDSLLLTRYARTLPSSLQRWYAAVTARKVARYERSAYSQAHLVWTCSEEDRRLALQLAPDANVRVVPNGVDSDAFRPLTPCPPRSPRRLLYFGRLDYLPNIDAVAHFVRDILPLVLREEPECVLEIVGAGLQAPVSEIVQGNPAVRLIGRVEDIRMPLATADVVVVPLRMGGGTRLKILEALAMARPVVTTTVGAEGLTTVHGRELLVADDPILFAKAIVQLLRDTPRAATIGLTAASMVRSQYDWQTILTPACNELRAMVSESPR